MLIRPALVDDCAAIVGLIRELAAFEQLTHLVEVTPSGLAHQLFGPKPAAEAWVVERPVSGRAVEPPEGGSIIAFALAFPNFSTFLGRPGLYLEDLYVQPAWRGQGIGQALLRHLAGLAIERGCGRFEWSVLDWNTRAIGFYEKLGASVLPDWRICRVTGDRLVALAHSSIEAHGSAPAAGLEGRQ